MYLHLFCSFEWRISRLLIESFCLLTYRWVPSFLGQCVTDGGHSVENGPIMADFGWPNSWRKTLLPSLSVSLPKNLTLHGYEDILSWRGTKSGFHIIRCTNYSSRDGVFLIFLFGCVYNLCQPATNIVGSKIVSCLGWNNLSLYTPTVFKIQIINGFPVTPKLHHLALCH